MSGIEVMVELGINYSESIAGDLPDDVVRKLRQIFKDFITEKTSFHTCCTKVTELIGKDDPVVRINDILNLPEEPLPFNEDEDESDAASIRKKTRTWSIAEDQRLLAGVFHYGLENWQAVAQFLGSGRNRAQCSQRWTRCLNPKISKKTWSAEEDKTLESLVRIHGEKSWTKISSIMGNRSDVQCRYRYRQIIQGSNSGQNSCAEDSFNMPLSRNTPLTMSSDAFILNRPMISGPMMTSFTPIPEEEGEDRISLSSTRYSTCSMPVFNLGCQMPYNGMQPMEMMQQQPTFMQQFTYAPRPYGFNVEVRSPPARIPFDMPRMPPKIQAAQTPDQVQPMWATSNKPPPQPTPTTTQSGKLDDFLSHFK